MRDFKLCNMVLRPDEHMAGHADVYYRCDGETAFDATERALQFSGTLDLVTYFNALSIAKWRRYTCVENAWLHLELAGDPCGLAVVACGPDAAESEKSTTKLTPKGGEGFSSFEVELPLAGEKDVLQGVVLRSEGSSRVRNAYYYAKVGEDSVHDVRLAVCTTTFKKESYITRNIQLVRDRIVHGGEAVASGFHMFVIDNGRTLDEALGGDGVTIVPNANVGGAGGFACGMMQALESDGDFTHVLLMDDDVRVSPESIARTYNLVSLANGEYSDAFVNGAMLRMEEPDHQHEDVGVVIPTGNFDRVKPDFVLGDLCDIVENETIDVEVPNAYGAWWYSCIPVEAIRKNGLPLPVFVRCDDIEYGMRCKPRYMTMNGICVWHEGFGGRILASADCYQNVRNFLIMTSLHGMDQVERMFMVRTESNFRMHMRTMYYDAAEMIVEAVEDYLKGPDFLAEVDGEALFKKNGARNEKLVPLDELDPRVTEHLSINKDALGLKSQTGRFGKMLRLLPYDRHYLPDFMLRENAASVFYCGAMRPDPSLFARKTLVAMDADATHGCVRRMDKRRWREIRQRWKAAKHAYESRRDEVKKAYQEALPRLSSSAFWKDYLEARK